jgi:F0F1-type ATP synthase alpha subunit
MPIWQMYVALLGATQGAFDSVPIEKIKATQDSLFRELEQSHKKLIDEVNTGAEPKSSTRETLLKAAKDVAKTYEATPKEKAIEIAAEQAEALNA